MMNIDNFYWSPGLERLLYSQFLLWKGYYRPMGGVFYLPILSFWGLNPAPYHVGLSLLMMGCVYLVYRLVRQLGGGQLAGGLAALVTCYHAGLANLYYNTAFVYDALCGFFLLAALDYYIGIRKRERQLNLRQQAVFTALFMCALNSKEMALMLPALVLAYEWIYHPPADRKWGALTAWLRAQGSVAVFAGLLTVLDLYGKVFGYDALTGMAGYQPVFSWYRLLDYQKTFLRDAAFFETGGLGVLVFWLTISYLAWRPAARPILRFCWAFLVITPLPIEFLPGKSQACLYIPMIGLAVFVVVVLVDLAQALVGVVAVEPIFRRVSRPVLMSVLVVAAIFYWGRENRLRQKRYVKPVMAALGAQTWQVIEEFRALHPHVRPHSHVVFLNDPFVEWDMLFIADLWFRDRTVTVRLQRMTPLSSQELEGSDAVFDYRDQKLIRVR